MGLILYNKQWGRLRQHVSNSRSPFNICNEVFDVSRQQPTTTIVIGQVVNSCMCTDPRRSQGVQEGLERNALESGNEPGSNGVLKGFNRGHGGSSGRARLTEVCKTREMAFLSARGQEHERRRGV